jgi:hypothetical protein
VTITSDVMPKLTVLLPKGSGKPFLNVNAPLVYKNKNNAKTDFLLLLS